MLEGIIFDFDAICAGDSVAHKKPAPDVYLAALDELGLRAASCIAVEDSENDLRAARAADLAVVVTKSLYTMHEDFEDVRVVLDSLRSPCPQSRVSGAPIDVPVLQRLIAGQ